MRFAKFALPAGMLAALVIGGLVAPTPSFGTQQYAKDTKKACTFCHVKPGAAADMHKDPNLTDAGKYFKEHNHSLDGYKAPAGK